jgi:hypothetical protein
MIGGLRRLGYELVTVGELLEAPGYRGRHGA